MVRRFLRLNAWAFVLDISAVSSLAIIGAGRHCLVFFWLGLVVVFFLAFNGIRLHSHYPDRVRVLDILIKKNKQGIREDSFCEFMYAPCGRMVVREALDILGEKRLYKKLAASCPLFSRKLLRERTSLEIIPYADDAGAED